MGGLVVLTPDLDIEQGLTGLFSRPTALGIRMPRIEWLRHKQRDPGVFREAHLLLARYSGTAAHALIVLDHAFSGAPLAREVELDIEGRCSPIWGMRARAVCIEPEIEAWIWSDSPNVARVLGWDSMESLRPWLEARGLWRRSEPKPVDPKAAYLAAIAEKRVPYSAADFHTLGATVSVRRCQDQAFARTLAILREWYGLDRDGDAERGPTTVPSR